MTPPGRARAYVVSIRREKAWNLRLVSVCAEYHYNIL